MKKILFVFLMYSISAQVSHAQWMQVPGGMGNSAFVYSLAVTGDTVFAGTRFNGVYKSVNNGANWIQTSLNNVTVTALVASGNMVFAGISFLGTGVYKSTDGGTSWAQTSLNTMNILSLARYGDTIFAGTNGNVGVYRSTNNGTNWTQTSLNNVNVPALIINGSVIYAGTGGDRGVYKSIDNGANWTQTPLNNKTVISLAVSGSYVFAGLFGNNGVYRSLNNGTNWNQTSLNNRQINCLVTNGINVFAGTPNFGIYVSNDTGASWVQRNEGFGPNATCLALCILNNYIFTGTQDSSVYKRLIGEVIGIERIIAEVPSSFSLGQNYPNPFNPNTKIQFSIFKSTSAKLTIYDVSGRVMAILVNKELKPGVYEVDWDASRRASGIYYYKLEAESYTETKKMVLVK